MASEQRSSTPSERQKAFANFVTLRNGRVAAICEHCGKRSKSTEPDTDRGGEPIQWKIPGWASAPYPHDCKHENGSMGSTWCCPACNKRLKAGEALPILGGGGMARMVL